MPPRNEDLIEGGVDEPDLVIESVDLPANGIRTGNTGVTTFAIEVRLCGGEHWTLDKRYSEMRALHKHLKSVRAAVKNLNFPRKRFRRTSNPTFLENRRQALEQYFCMLLQIRPLLRCELFNFFSVNINVLEFRRMQRSSTNEMNNIVATMEEDFESVQEESAIDNEAGNNSIRDEMGNNEVIGSQHSSEPPLASLSTGSRRNDRSSYYESHLVTYEAIPLEDLVEKCEHMDELQAMSENVVVRLLRLRNKLHANEMSPMNSPDVDMYTSFVQICQRFRAFLEQHGNRNIVERIASARTLTRVLSEFNSELDSFHAVDNIPWKDTWSDMIRDVEQALGNIVEQLPTELSDSNSQRDALILLNNEARQSELENGLRSQRLNSYAPQESVQVAAEIVEVAVERVERMSEGVVNESVPDRFIAEHEIQRDQETLSSGSSGKVYRGIWCGVKVVIKYVEVSTPEEMHSFLLEDKIWHMARHPNVVTYYGACHLPRPCFLVSEEATNGNCIDYIARKKMSGRSVMWGLMYGAALGLRFLHSNMIIHGDLACRNILVDMNGVAKLVDFGMSSLNGSSPTAYVGPIRWAAPECVVRNQPPSFQSDSYSMGMCIIEAATGRDPWGGLSEIAVHSKLAHKEFLTQPAELNDDQWRLVTSLCAFEPSQRCSLDEAVAQLKAFADAEMNAYATPLQALSRFRNHRRSSI